MTIDNVALDDQIAWGFVGGPEFGTNVLQTANGRNRRKGKRSIPIHSWNFEYDPRPLSEIYELRSFFYARQGRLRGFLFKDWSDYRSSSGVDDITMLDQELGSGDGVETEFNLVKLYDDTFNEYNRIIYYINGSTLVVAKDGVLVNPADYTWTQGTSLVFDTAPANGVTITAGFEFYVPVYFTNDKFEVELIVGEDRTAPVEPLGRVRNLGLTEDIR